MSYTRSLRRRKIRREDVAQREQFFALLRRVVVLRNEKERKNGPLCRVRNRIIFYGADSYPACGDTSPPVVAPISFHEFFLGAPRSLIVLFELGHPSILDPELGHPWILNWDTHRSQS